MGWCVLFQLCGSCRKPDGCVPDSSAMGIIWSLGHITKNPLLQLMLLDVHRVTVMSWQEQTWGMMMHSVICVRLLTAFQTTASSVPGTTVQAGPLGEPQLARI